MRRAWVLAAVLAAVLVALAAWWIMGGGGGGRWPVVESNIHIDRVPRVEDFVPVGVTYELGERGLLSYTDDSMWKQSCFIIVAFGWSRDGHTLFYQGRLPFTGEGSFRPRICVDGEYLRGVPAFGGGMYYTNGTGELPYPTVYVRGRGGYIESISYDFRRQRWIHLIKRLGGGGGLELSFVGYALGKPFWIGPMEGPYIVHGAYSRVKDIDIWGGFWVSGVFEANLTVGGRQLEFRGHFLFDRAVHRVYYGEASRAGPVRGATGGVLAFSCMVIFHRDFYIMLSHSVNPTPADFPRFQHQGRVNFVRTGESYVLEEFTLRDLGSLIQPSGFKLEARFKAGYINLTGKVVAYWPPGGWKPNKGTWWDPNAKHTWGRALVNWTGTVVLHGKAIKVTAVGIGEFTRVASSSQAWSHLTPPELQAARRQEPYSCS